MAGTFPAFVAEGLRKERFTLLDVGCSGGLDRRWRVFGDRLRALGIDASEAECRRLAACESNPDVDYLAAFVGRRADSIVNLSAGPAAPLIMQMRDRLSFMRTREIREARLKGASAEEQFRNNAWEMTGLADPAKPVVVPGLLAARGWSDIDYLKIDIDGVDYEVLRSFDGRFESLGLLAVQLEVNFIGSGATDEHTFHNTDRFMRRQGFDLFRLDVRTYSTRALPARYVWPTPAETLSGRPFQGEAYYARDILGPKGAEWATQLSEEKLAKLAAVLSAWGIPDAAAELMLGLRGRLAPIFDIERGLDLLAAQTQGGEKRPLSYREYMARFEADAREFYRPEGDIPMRERWKAAWRSFWYPRAQR
ncbi:MAG: FkbM family methyltransferase [Reyranella sp.]|nr:FkbM family methyltransferase [Reyranella sp.]